LNKSFFTIILVVQSVYQVLTVIGEINQ